jgi:hypothetical protein
LPFFPLCSLWLSLPFLLDAGLEPRKREENGFSVCPFPSDFVLPALSVSKGGFRIFPPGPPEAAMGSTSGGLACQIGVWGSRAL